MWRTLHGEIRTATAGTPDLVGSFDQRAASHRQLPGSPPSVKQCAAFSVSAMAGTNLGAEERCLVEVPPKEVAVLSCCNQTHTQYPHTTWPSGELAAQMTSRRRYGVLAYLRDTHITHTSHTCISALVWTCR